MDLCQYSVLTSRDVFTSYRFQTTLSPTVTPLNSYSSRTTQSVKRVSMPNTRSAKEENAINSLEEETKHHYRLGLKSCVRKLYRHIGPFRNDWIWLWIRLRLAWPRGCFDNCACFAYTRSSGLQTRVRSLKTNPKPQSLFRKRQ